MYPPFSPIAMREIQGNSAKAASPRAAGGPLAYRMCKRFLRFRLCCCQCFRQLALNPDFRLTVVASTLTRPRMNGASRSARQIAHAGCIEGNRPGEAQGGTTHPVRNGRRGFARPASPFRIDLITGAARILEYFEFYSRSATSARAELSALVPFALQHQEHCDSRASLQRGWCAMREILSNPARSRIPPTSPFARAATVASCPCGSDAAEADCRSIRNLDRSLVTEWTSAEAFRCISEGDGDCVACSSVNP